MEYSILKLVPTSSVKCIGIKLKFVVCSPSHSHKWFNSKSHKRVHFESCLGGHFSIKVQLILKMLTVLETVIQGLYFFCCNLLDICAPWPRKWGSRSLPSSKQCITLMADFDLSETTKDSSFKIQQGIALDSLYIFIRYDVTSYFWSAANPTNVLILCHVWVVISRQWFNRFFKSLQFCKLWFKGIISSSVT